MPSRRPFAGRSLAALLLLVIALGATQPVAAANVPANHRGASTPVDAAIGLRAGAIGHAAPGQDAGNRTDPLRGRLARLVEAARAGSLQSGAYLGFETAPSPLGDGVAVSLHLADAGGEAALGALLANGGRIANRKGADVETYLPARALATLQSLPGIEQAEAIIRPVPLGSGLGTAGEGVALHHADVWQAAGVLGQGIKVGVIDGGFVGLTSRLGGELPASVHARCYREIGVYSSTARSCEAFTEHGTAVAETIVDMAPGASLYLADPVSMQDLQSTVAWMTSNGVKVINVSLGFAFDGPGDGTSPANSVYSVVDQAVKGGALWVNAAGNAGEDGWAGTWKDANHNGLLDFATGDEGNAMALQAGDSVLVTMRWNDQWGASANDYDLYMYSSNGAIVAASEDPQTGDGDPVETLSFTPSSSGVYRIVVQRANGSAASKLQLLVLTSEDTALQHRTATGTLPSPADSANPGMLSVGAVSFDAPDTIESYSSRGPTVDDRIKPDLVAADCTTTTVLKPFCGTSESSPYVAGAAALVLSSQPALTPSQLATWLRSRAVPLGSPSPNSIYGSGRLDLGAPPQPPTATSLTFAAQPSVAIAQVAFSRSPTVRILDQDSETLTAGSAAAGPVTLSLGTNPSGATLDCIGGLTQAAVAGVATFEGCTVSAEGEGVTLVATSGALPPVTSQPFRVLPVGSTPAPELDGSGSASAIPWGSAVVLRAQLSAGAAGPGLASLAGRTVVFEKSSTGTAWSPAGGGTTDADGLATLSYRPVTNMYYRATFAGTTDLGAAISGAFRVTVRQTATLRPTNAGLTKSISRNRTVTFTTLVRPSRSDVPAGVVTFEVYRRSGSTWRLVSTRDAAPDLSGVASMSVAFSQSGAWYVRSIARPTKVNANSTWTGPEVYEVP